MIVLFTTGGTFDKIYFDAKNEFSVGDPQVGAILEEVNVGVEYHVESLLRKDSLDMSDGDRQLICERVTANAAQHVVITHGTDSMVATAAALAKSDIKDKTIVLVGSMQPARMKHSDAPFNLGFAFGVVQLLTPGVYVAMNGQVFAHDNVVKNLDQSIFEKVS